MVVLSILVFVLGYVICLFDASWAHPPSMHIILLDTLPRLSFQMTSHNWDAQKYFNAIRVKIVIRETYGEMLHLLHLGCDHLKPTLSKNTDYNFF